MEYEEKFIKVAPIVHAPPWYAPWRQVVVDLVLHTDVNGLQSDIYENCGTMEITLKFHKHERGEDGEGV